MTLYFGQVRMISSCRLAVLRETPLIATNSWRFTFIQGVLERDDLNLSHPSKRRPLFDNSDLTANSTAIKLLDIVITRGDFDRFIKTSQTAISGSFFFALESHTFSCAVILIWFSSVSLFRARSPWTNKHSLSNDYLNSLSTYILHLSVELSSILITIIHER